MFTFAVKHNMCAIFFWIRGSSPLPCSYQNGFRSALAGRKQQTPQRHGTIKQ